MYPSDDSPTYGIFVKNQVEAIKQYNHQVDIAVVKDPRMGKLFVLKKYLIWFLKVISILLFKGRKYDIIHAHYVFPSGLFGLLFKKLYGTKLVVTAHGGDIDKMSKKGPFFFNQTKNILKKANHVIAVGEELKREINETFGIEPEKISVLNMGVNREVFKPIEKDKAKVELNQPLDKFSVLFVGNYIKAKGLIELLDAYNMLKKKYPFIELHLIGATKQEEFKKELDEKIESEQIKDVKIHSTKNQQQLAKWMAAADLFVLPSYIEGFGLVALEAMSVRTPVVGSKVGGLAYLLQDGSGVLVEAQNTDSLRKGMENIITNKDLQKQLIDKGEEKAQENDQRILLNKLFTIYEKL
ncbi:glycosyl transferase family 1 [Virgibacillus profundi]|uniref:Glycosyl transferase family 1 n=2 Tax=Virgibacillus profundi TaxID=2024555 RepID=A0A2A2IK87_9BACI|nr:glycosyl transferase family 1 [Virgibacillus profundi]PXY55870.1 glycosyltransferase family 4 protein [Virgibacillus profundi]